MLKLTRIIKKYSTKTNLLSTNPLFNKILIANRGEIACRIIKTAKRLGIKTVAVYSDADIHSMYVQMADEAYRIGPPPSAESYLQMDKIIQVARDSGAQAIHPGYGFLSENPNFAQKVVENGLEFIGPPVKAIVDMGSKSASKQIMEKANVPVVPGYWGVNQDPLHLKNEAIKMGFPVLIKAVKGGGGKGMRIVENEQDFELMLESSKREAIKSFGDDKVLVEKYITRPRHIEVQVFADKLGNCVYLFERDCSVQRRHQKVLEEAPAPHLSPELRADLGAKACAAAKAVNYVGAGTVEFIFDTTSNKYYFMEMNTRLQVEHPVTEMVTNTDLVEWQLEVASGNQLPKLQADLVLDGHAFEARIYAENPSNNFLPDTGPLLHLSLPPPATNLRIETGVEQGDVVSVYYDPMISKLVVHGKDRSEALRVLVKALGEFEVVGLNTNIEFLKKISTHPSFVMGDVETGFIKKHESDLFPKETILNPKILAIAALSIIDKESMHWSLSNKIKDPYSPWTRLEGFRLNHMFSKTLSLEFESKMYEIQTTFLDQEKFEISILDKKNKEPIAVYKDARILKTDNPTCLTASIGDELIKSNVVLVSDQVHVFYQGAKTVLKQPLALLNVGNNKSSESQHSVTTPMPCKISQINIKQGDIVKKGQALVILEAMKMEHVIRSPIDGEIKKVFYKVNDLVGQGKQLVSFVENK